MDSSGSDKGFFQTPPTLANQFYEDASYKRCFKLFLTKQIVEKVTPEVANIGKEVISDQIFSWITDSEHNKPYLKGSGRDAFGHWTGELVTGEGWRGLQRFGLANGFVATGYDTPYGPFARALQFLRLHLWEPSSANVTCPSAMQDGAACLLKRHLSSSKLSEQERKVFEDAFSRLTSRDPTVAWTSGQWMTERTGGSDVSLTETTAVFNPGEPGELAAEEGQIPLGPWRINGFKWFSSATDSNMTVLLAKTSKGGLSAFLAPMRRHDPLATTAAGQVNPHGQRLNGVRIQRLKNKHGTQSLPTAELVLQDMRGWLIGEEGKGIHEIATILTLTRVHSAVSAIGAVGRSLAIARAYARVREVGAGRKARMRLIDSPLHMRTLAKMSSEYHGLMLLTYFSAYILGVSEHPREPPSDLSPALKALTPEPKLIGPLLRVLSQLVKAYVCKPSVSLVFSCMESVGGVGYLNNEESEYLNISRIYRDTSVLPIWEGTSDVLSTDFIRALKHPAAGKACIAALDDFINKAASFPSNKKPNGWQPESRWNGLKTYINSKSQEELMGEARELLWQIGDILVSLLLYVDAASDSDAAVQEILERFVEDKFHTGKRQRGSPAKELQRDLSIVYGSSGLESQPKL